MARFTVNYNCSKYIWHALHIITTKPESCLSDAESWSTRMVYLWSLRANSYQPFLLRQAYLSLDMVATVYEVIPWPFKNFIAGPTTELKPSTRSPNVGLAPDDTKKACKRALIFRALPRATVGTKKMVILWFVAVVQPVRHQQLRLNPSWSSPPVSPAGPVTITAAAAGRTAGRRPFAQF